MYFLFRFIYEVQQGILRAKGYHIMPKLDTKSILRICITFSWTGHFLLDRSFFVDRPLAGKHFIGFKYMVVYFHFHPIMSIMI